MVSVSLSGSPNYNPVIHPQAYQQAHLRRAPKLFTLVLRPTIRGNSVWGWNPGGHQFGENAHDEKLEQHYLTVSQTCEALNVSRTTLYRLTRHGLIRFTKIGRSVRYRATEITRFVNDTERRSRENEVGF